MYYQKIQKSIVLKFLSKDAYIILMYSTENKRKIRKQQTVFIPQYTYLYIFFILSYDHSLVFTFLSLFVE